MPDGSTAGPRAGLRFARRCWSGLVPALIAIAGLAILDTQPDLVIIGFFAVVPFTAALSGDVRATAIVAR